MSSQRKFLKEMREAMAGGLTPSSPEVQAIIRKYQMAGDLPWFRPPTLRGKVWLWARIRWTQALSCFRRPISVDEAFHRVVPMTLTHAEGKAVENLAGPRVLKSPT